jgi:inorganic pyrophosphatase
MAQGSPEHDDDLLHCVVEIPKGSRNKYEWDERLQAIKLDRFLFSSVVYPTDYGYIPNTLAGDGDPLDVMVTVSEPTFPGCVILVKPIAVFKTRDEKGRDEKILCVPITDPNWNEFDTLEDLPKQLCDEIAWFFSMYKTPEGKEVEVDGWFSKEDAWDCIEASRRRFRERGEERERSAER